MSPASYLTAPPRVAGGSLPRLFPASLLRQFDQPRAAFGDSARIGDPRQQPAELRPFLVVDAREEPFLDLCDRSFGGCDVRAAFLGEFHDVAPAIGGIASADD